MSSVTDFVCRALLCIIRTRPDTRLPQSRAGGQGPFLRSMEDLGRSSMAKKMCDGQTDGQMDRRLDGLTDRQTDGWTDRRMNGRTDRRKDGQTDKVGCKVA